MSLDVSRLVARCATVVALGISAPVHAEPPDAPAPTRAGAAKAGEDKIRPLPLAPIPSDPPPHEGALIDIPYIVEPPDLLLIEVLEALPGRPITGERLVRPDGTINLGFYGVVHVRGLTVPQVKVKVVEHLRRILRDDVLGLEALDFEEPEPGAPTPDRGGSLPGVPDTGTSPSRLDEPSKKPVNEDDPESRVAVPRIRKTAETRESGPGRQPKSRDSSRNSVRTISEKEVQPTKVQIPAIGGIKITIEVQNAPEEVPGQQQPVASVPLPPGKLIRIAPADTDRVFVEVTAFNSKVYFVQGDVAQPGRLPHTGNETVLDAINYAGGLIPTADPKNIQMVRPARGGKPSRTYRVDLEAITERGDLKANYQLFPGDRLIVGRNAVVNATVAVDRLAGPFQMVLSHLMHYSYAVHALSSAGMTPAQREALLKKWADLYWKNAAGPSEATLDEKTFKEMLLRDPVPAPGVPGAVRPGEP